MMARRRPTRVPQGKLPRAKRRIERHIIGRLLRGRSLALVIVALLAALAWESGALRLLGDDGTAVAQQATGTTGERFRGRITRIVDGDTFWMDSAPVRIRVWALDAPEIGQPGGDAATEAMRQLTADRELECLTRDIDRFGRIVAQCWLPDGRDITAAMIASGTAREFCRFSRNHYGTC